jgi:peptidoglycan/LPS O-acetylase OafA/YrhL
MNVTFGVLIADLQVQYGPKLQKRVPEVVSVLLIVLGIMCAGYPQDAPETAGWSEAMRTLMFAITPASADLRRYWDSLGASLILLGVFCSATARQVLCSRLLNFMGRVSFPVYLLHNQLVKTFLTWLVYLPSFVRWSLEHPLREDQDKLVLVRGSGWQVLASCAVFLYVLYRIAWHWTVIVDPWCMKLVGAGMRAAHGENESLGIEVEKRKILG